MVLYLYRDFLALTAQNALQYSLPFTHSHTHSYIASTSSFSYEEQFKVEHIAQGHFGTQMGRTGIELLTFWLEDDRSTPQPKLLTMLVSFHFYVKYMSLL